MRDFITYEAAAYSVRPAIVVDLGPGTHPRGRKRTYVAAVIFKDNSRVRIVEWHIRELVDVQSRKPAYRVLSSHPNAIGNYWQFDFDTYEEVTQFLRHMAKNYN